MYCVFCGKPDVICCPRCGRWVCPRHQQVCRSQTVCVGCGRALARVRAAKIYLSVIALGMIGLTVLLAFAR
jgi:hypothetical protein